MRGCPQLSIDNLGLLSGQHSETFLDEHTIFAVLVLGREAGRMSRDRLRTVRSSLLQGVHTSAALVQVIPQEHSNETLAFKKLKNLKYRTSPNKDFLKFISDAKQAQQLILIKCLNSTGLLGIILINYSYRSTRFRRTNVFLSVDSLGLQLPNHWRDRPAALALEHRNRQDVQLYT